MLTYYVGQLFRLTDTSVAFILHFFHSNFERQYLHFEASIDSRSQKGNVEFIHGTEFLNTVAYTNTSPNAILK